MLCSNDTVGFPWSAPVLSRLLGAGRGHAPSEPPSAPAARPRRGGGPRARRSWGDPREGPGARPESPPESARGGPSASPSLHGGGGGGVSRRVPPTVCAALAGLGSGGGGGGVLEVRRVPSRVSPQLRRALGPPPRLGLAVGADGGSLGAWPRPAPSSRLRANPYPEVT